MSRHVAFFNIPALGHLYPTLAVVAELTRRGYRVSYTSTDARAPMIEAVGATLVPYLSSRPTENETWDPAPDRSEYLAHSLLSFLEEAELTLPQVEPVFDADPPDLVVYDRLSFAGRAFAARHRIPAVQSWPMLVSNEHWSLFRDVAPFDAGNPTFLTYLAKLAAFLSTQGLRIAAEDFLDEPAPVLDLCYYPRAFQYRGERFDDRYRFVGPCPRPSTGTGWTRPADGTPLALVALGTLDNRHPEFFHACVEAFTAPGWHAVLAIGERLDPAAFRPHPAHVEIHQVVAQPDVLAHARAMVCHAGLNSVMEALYHGVPLVVVPRTLEQESNAARVVELGLGVALPPDGVSAGLLRETVDRVAADPRIAQRVRELRGQMREAGGAVAAADAIESALAQDPPQDPPHGPSTRPPAATGIPALTPTGLRRRLAELVVAACDGEVGVDQVLAAGSLVLIGVGSLASLRIIDAVETEFGLPLDIEDDPSFLDSVDGLAAHLLRQGLRVDSPG
jgi:MGT family glycosyltransferase